jgi:hypothetical protein
MEVEKPIVAQVAVERRNCCVSGEVGGLWYAFRQERCAMIGAFGMDCFMEWSAMSEIEKMHLKTLGI